MIDSENYVFGDNDREGMRLDLLDRVFTPASRRLLEKVTGSFGLAYDLGCGQGATARLLADVVAPTAIVGLDNSDALLRRAREACAPRARFIKHDVSETPFPAGTADLIYARFLLAHLAKPDSVARVWAAQLNPAGTLVLDEIEWIKTEEPAFEVHLELLTKMVKRTRALLFAGPKLWDIARNSGLKTWSIGVHELDVPTDAAAGLFRLSLGNFGAKAIEYELISERELRYLAGELEYLAIHSSKSQNTWGLHQAVYRNA